MLCVGGAVAAVVVIAVAVFCGVGGRAEPFAGKADWLLGNCLAVAARSPKTLLGIIENVIGNYENVIGNQ